MPQYDTTWLVAGELMAVGRVAVEAAAYMLGINPPQIRWLIERPSGDGEWFECPINGYCARDGQTVFFRRDLSPFGVADAAAHETRHAWQIKTGLRDRRVRMLERDAEIFCM